MTELIRKELIHKWGMSPEDFLKEIENTGGWPETYKYVSFFHDGIDGDRFCKFSNVRLHTGWWTTVASSDDYYYYKLSDEKKKEILKEARRVLINQLR